VCTCTASSRRGTKDAAAAGFSRTRPASSISESPRSAAGGICRTSDATGVSSGIRVRLSRSSRAVSVVRRAAWRAVSPAARTLSSGGRPSRSTSRRARARSISDWRRSSWVSSARRSTSWRRILASASWRADSLLLAPMKVTAPTLCAPVSVPARHEPSLPSTRHWGGAAARADGIQLTRESTERMMSDGTPISALSASGTRTSARVLPLAVGEEVPRSSCVSRSGRPSSPDNNRPSGLIQASAIPLASAAASSPSRSSPPTEEAKSTNI
jgi:hypothetical protein